MEHETITFPRMALTKAAAEQFGVTPAFVRRLCKEGKVKYTVIGCRRWLINLDSLAHYFEQGEPAPLPAENPQAQTVRGIRRIDFV